MTRTEERKYRIELLKILKEKVGIVTSENGFDWAVPYVHCFGYGSYGERGFPIPLFELVFHDATIRYRHSDFEGRFPVPKRFWPQNYLYAESVLTWLLRGDTLDLVFYGPLSEADKEMIKELYRIVDKVHSLIGFDEMTSHKILTDDYTVQKTAFSSGMEIFVNYGPKDCTTDDGKTVPMHGFLVEGPKLGTMIGRFRTTLELRGSEKT